MEIESGEAGAYRGPTARDLADSLARTSLGRAAALVVAEKRNQLALLCPCAAAAVKNSALDLLRYEWQLRLRASAPSWTQRSQGTWHSDTAAALAWDPRTFDSSKCGRFLNVTPPSTRVKEDFGVTREDHNALPKPGQVFPDSGPNLLFRDPILHELSIRAVRWPTVPYDAQIVSRSWTPQFPTVTAARAEVQWALRGAMLEFHRPRKFLNHLHIHLVPAETAPVTKYLGDFTVIEQGGGVEIGQIGFFSRNIALRSRDPIAMELATFSLADFLERKAKSWYLQGMAYDRDSAAWVSYFLPLKKQDLPFGIRASGIIQIRDPELRADPAKVEQIIDGFWLDQSGIAAIRTKWAQSWRSAAFRTSFQTVAPEPIKVSDFLLPASDYAKLLAGAAPCESLDAELVPVERPPAKIILTYHGRVAPLKNLTVFVKTAKRVIEYLQYIGKSARAEIIGGGQRHDGYGSYLRDLVKREGLEDFVSFGEPYETKDLAARYGSSVQKRIGIFPGEDESFGLAPLEAMRLGVPIVVPDQGAVQELLQGKHSVGGGRIVAVQGLDMEEKATRFAHAVLALYLDPASVKFERERAYQLSLEYTADKMTADYARLFRTQMTSTSGTCATLEYISPGLFPYEHGGIAQWARNLFARLPEHFLELNGFVPALNLRSLAPVGWQQITDENARVLERFENFSAHTFSRGPHARTVTSAVSEADREALRGFFEELLAIPAAKDFASGLRALRTGPDQIRRLFALHRLYSLHGAALIEGALIPEVLGEAGFAKEEIAQLYQNGRFVDGSMFDFLKIPLPTAPVLSLIDSPHPFGLYGVLGRYFSPAGERAVPAPLIFVQHSRGSEANFRRISEQSAGQPFRARVSHALALLFARLYYDHASCFVAVSRLVQRELQDSFGIAGDRIVLIPNGIDLDVKAAPR